MLSLLLQLTSTNTFNLTGTYNHIRRIQVIINQHGKIDISQPGIRKQYGWSRHAKPTFVLRDVAAKQAIAKTSAFENFVLR